ncbi:MAG: carboxylating nicotinate-nucleotide diphosphorylase [Thermodesulfobacteriota bacterium]|nr:carboxylating nicotinate-nucleotide diphosphorylase [Thermodesulfobacteriota bacterium]
MNTHELITRIIDLALYEDGQDVTSLSIFGPDDVMEGVIRVKEAGIIAGIDVAGRVFSTVSQEIDCRFHVPDGAVVRAGDIIAHVKGPSVSVLCGERVALNFLQRMSGIATLTSRYVDRIQDTRARILDTRKTCPGNRVLDKMAVRIGGGMNHRMGLYDMALIKDNHIDRAGSITDALMRLRSKAADIPVEVEARCLADVEELLGLRVDRIMLDNFSLEEMRNAVGMVDGRVALEASGGITLDTLRDVALTGVDYISVGDLTHSVRALDISMITGKIL